MIKVCKLVWVIALGCSIMTGCMYWKSIPETQVISDPVYSYSASLTPHGSRGEGFEGFDLSVQNNTDRDIKILWDRTLYVMGNITNGRFYFAGDYYEHANDPKPPDIVFKKTTFEKKIFPCYLLEYERGDDGKRYWYSKIMPEGENGIYLIVQVEGQETSNKIMVSLTKKR